MSARRMKVSKCPSDVLTMTNRSPFLDWCLLNYVVKEDKLNVFNIVKPLMPLFSPSQLEIWDFNFFTIPTISIHRAIVNPGDFDKKSTPHIDVRTGPGQHFVFTIECDGKVTIMMDK